MNPRPLFPLYAALLLLVVVACQTSVTPVQVQISAGSIEGTASEGINRFLGIPYAAAPVNELRWAPPAPVTPWEGVRKTKEFGPWCPQHDNDRKEEGNTWSGEGWTIFANIPVAKQSSEDCLSLNVWAPANAKAAPVMVFLHGNALGTSFPIYDGSAFAHDGIVFVSLNFRLLTLGNFAHPALTAQATANAPLGRYMELDQLAGLQWVQDNIAAFGGDPGNVTLVGSSAGGAAILQLLTTEHAKGLFHKAIVQSGNGWWEPVSHADNERIGCLLVTMAGLNGCAATADELRQLPWQQLPFTSPYAIDGHRWQQGATELIAAGKALDIPLLIGWNDFDGSSLRYSPTEVMQSTQADTLAVYKGKDPAIADDALAYSLYTDLHSGAPARWVAQQLAGGEPVYLYLFSYVLSRERDEKRGAEHAYELPHVFNSWDKYLSPITAALFITDEDRQMTTTLHACWVAFIKTGKPQCAGTPEWPAYTRASDQLMELNLQPRVLTRFRAEQLDAQERAMQHYFAQQRDSIAQLIESGVSSQK
jgi:para-nitrobenzyl esterase